ncbi:psbP domain-containing protein 3, chloroplastic [Iris pallida]|uniref:PsbP domain-containing protein 3, chloroplastic n=1 Tax=Iris pallida TaxID=29817 RepID=A0AAX6E7D8_IRIPA|nr:psbP domain-containing protein 3, chloroplastic [Iris pallida]
MASVFSSLPPASPPLTRSREIPQIRSRSIQSVEKSRLDNRSRTCFDDRSGTRRRDALLGIFMTTVSFPVVAMKAIAETDVQEGFRTYEDETNKFRILMPEDWLVGAGDTKSIKSVTAFYPEEASDSNVSVAITGIGPDFTGLKSFGSVDEFAETLVSGLDRSWRRPPGVAAKLIDCKSKNGLYYIEYTLQNPGESRRHIVSAIGMAFNGWYNRLYTVSGQFVEDGSEKYRSQIEKAVSSFRLI